ncbi:Protein TRANSPARENT TESTA 12 [Hordeum vulgare]|nr:Protein TRANSPARENT TESTA 12 [Hordeum vulgare]
MEAESHDSADWDADLEAESHDSVAAFHSQLWEPIKRVKISCKDHTKILEERLFGVKGKIYRLLIEVEPPRADGETFAATNPSLDTQTSVESRFTHSASIDGRFPEGSTTGSNIGSLTG